MAASSDYQLDVAVHVSLSGAQLFSPVLNMLVRRVLAEYEGVVTLSWIEPSQPDAPASYVS